MPTPPQAPTGPDGTGDDGTRIGTTPKGNRSVSSGAGTYIFTPKGKLILYMTPKIGGLQQTHNLQKQTVTVNFGTAAKGGTIDQKGTYEAVCTACLLHELRPHMHSRTLRVTLEIREYIHGRAL